MIELVKKVLDEKRIEGKKRCRHSDNNYTCIAYDMINRVNDVAYIRVDIYRASDMGKGTTRESQCGDDT